MIQNVIERIIAKPAALVELEEKALRLKMVDYVMIYRSRTLEAPLS